MKGLFGGHIGGSTGDLHTLFGGIFAQFGDEAKVEDHNAAFGGDEDVGGFEIAVQQPIAMEGCDALGEMRKRLKKAAKMHVGGFCGLGRSGRISRRDRRIG